MRDAAEAEGAAGVRTVLRVGIAGVIGGLAFALYSMIWFGLGDKTIWYPLNLVAHTIWRNAPTDGSFHAGAAILGLITLAVVGALALAPFAALAILIGMDPLTAIIGASIYANVIWIIGHYLVWERLDATAAHGFSAGVAWVAHFIAGLIAGAALVWLTSRNWAVGGKSA